MLSFFGSVLNYINTDTDTKNTILQSQLNKKLEQTIFEPVEKKLWINDKDGQKRKIKVNQRSFENRIRKIVSNYFGKEFKSVRPAFLKNVLTKRNLELDMYCEELNIALEYQGVQHIKYLPHFHKTEKNFKDQLLRDQMKARICRERGIKLIIIYHYEIENGDDILDSDILKLILEKMSKII